MSGFLLLALKKLGPIAAKKVKEVLLGKPTTIDDIKTLITDLGKVIDMLPAEISKRLNDQKNLGTLSLARNNIDKSEYKELCDFLNSASDKGYWFVVSRICIEMLGVDAHTLEVNRNNPKTIDFKKKDICKKQVPLFWKK